MNDLDYRVAVLTATALALARRHDAGQADGSETGQARPFIEYCAIVAGVATVVAAEALDPLQNGHEPPHFDGSDTGHAADCASRA